MDASLHQRPGWVSSQLFPASSRFLDIDSNTVHYVDEGSGPVLLMLHGNPAWSFLYRHLIAGLSDRFRCIAMDYPGFGLSTARPGYSYRPEEHARVVASFVDALQLNDITFVVNDWGGPIGFWVAGGHPDHVAGLVIANTWGWPLTGDKRAARFARLMGGPIGRALTRRFNLFVNATVPRGHRRTKLSRAERDHYRKPFPTPSARMATAILPGEILRSHNWLAEVEHRLQALRDKPVLLTWGDKDDAFREQELRRFQSLFPRATTVIMRGAGHFIADDAADDMITAIRDWAPTPQPPSAEPGN